MNSLKNKKILLGVTGSIATFKSPLLVRELIRRGAEIKVVMTDASQKFVSKMVMSNLSRNAVISDMFEESIQDTGAWHIKFAHECDLMIIAPCSASTLSKIAYGISDNALVALSLALEPSVPFIISPAMDTTMWLHPATQQSIKVLKSHGTLIIPPIDGDLSSGLIGPGRFPEINDIADYIEYVLKNWNRKNRYSQKIDKDTTEPKIQTQEERIKELIDSPLEPLQEAVDQIQFDSELQFHKMKNKLS